MVKISSLHDDDIKTAYRIIGRCYDALNIDISSRPSIDLESDVDKSVLKVDRETVGLIIYSMDDATFLGKTISERDEALDELGILGDDFVAIEFVFVDPMFQGHGYGRTLLEYVINFPEKRHVLAKIDQGNPNLGFMLKMGFQIAKRKENVLVLLRKYQENGLCRNIGW